MTVELADCSGRWFKVLHALVRSGVWASLPANQKALLVPLHAHRQEDGLMITPIDTIGREAGLGRSQTYDALKGLLAHPAGLLARAGSAYIVMPDHEFAARGSAPPGQSGIPETPVRDSGRSSGKPDDAPAAARALNQPTVREKSNSVRMVGWKSIGLFWDPRDTPSLRQLLTDLGLRGQVLEQTLGLEGLSVDEVAREAESIAADASVRNHAVVLAWRLANTRGLANAGKPRIDLGPLQRIVELRKARARAGCDTTHYGDDR